MAIPIRYFIGEAAVRAGTAAGLISAAARSNEEGRPALTAAVAGLRVNLSGVGVSDPRLRDLTVALDRYLAAAQGEEGVV